MNSQHRKISGYREMSQRDIELMNKIKALGPLIEEVITEVNNHISAQNRACAAFGLSDPAGDQYMSRDELDMVRNARTAREHLDRTQPERWAAIGETHFQEGLMALTRAVAQPTLF